VVERGLEDDRDVEHLVRFSFRTLALLERADLAAAGDAAIGRSEARLRSAFGEDVVGNELARDLGADGGLHRIDGAEWLAAPHRTCDFRRECGERGLELLRLFAEIAASER